VLLKKRYTDRRLDMSSQNLLDIPIDQWSERVTMVILEPSGHAER